MRTHSTFLALAIACSGYAQHAASNSVALPDHEARKLLKQCSRESPRGVDGFWQLPSKTVKDIDQSIGRVTELRTALGKIISEPSKYNRQYAGVKIGDRKLVYINAVLPDPFDLPWQTQAMIVCDGGSTSWGAIYDPANGRFSDLAINSSLDGA